MRTAGACPTVDEPFIAADGLLVRVSVPGGLLTAAQARSVAVAARLGNGIIELTRRANLQLRGFRDHARTAAAILADAGLDGDAPDIVMSPLTGFDATEAFDVRPLVAALSAALRSVVLPHKFGVVVDSGGLFPVHGVRASVCVQATAGPFCAHLPPCEGRCTQNASDDPSRGIVIGRSFSTMAAPVRRPVGALGSALGAAPLLGRLEPDILATIAALAESAAGEVRLTPWRDVVIPGARPEALDRLRELGLIVDRDHPALSVVACSGNTGCAEGLIDAQRLARGLIASLHIDRCDRHPTIHVSGCPKRCAMTEMADIELIG